MPAGRAAIIREGRAALVDLYRARTQGPNDRTQVMRRSQEGIDIYGRWKAAEEAAAGEGIRRPKIKKGVQGLDAIREKLDGSEQLMKRSSTSIRTGLWQ